MQDETAPNPDELLPEDREPDEAELDRFISEQDPEFAERMQSLSADKNLKAEDIVVDNATQELHDETQRWENSKGLWKLIYKVFRFTPKLSLALKKTYANLAVKIVAFSIASRNNLHDWGLSFWKGSRKAVTTGALGLVESIGSNFKKFGKLRLKIKFLLFGTIIFVAAAIYGVKFALSGRLLPGEQELFIANFADEGAEVFEYDTTDRQELFYDNVRSAPNLLLLTKMVVNIKPSSNSGENPMLAVEFFAEGMSPEPILEIKAREAFYRDRLQRKMEEYTFDVLDTPPGKQAMMADLLKDLNSNLSQGQLRGLRIKTIVLKP